MDTSPKAFGADESVKDSRTVKHEDYALAGTPLVKGGVSYLPENIEDQHQVGICTAISLIENRERANNKKYSADFQYLLQKKYFDLNWTEGSSIFYALKVGYKYGFLPAENWHFTTEADRQLPYAQYIAKLQAIPDEEITYLLSLCVDKIAGYASVDVSDPQALARAINESQAGILYRFNVGSEWWTGINGVVSWATALINPLRAPSHVISGHAIVCASFDFTSYMNFVLANTWGKLWCKQGCADVDWNTYKPTEAWTILTVAPEIPAFLFLNDLKFGQISPDVIQLQKILNKSPQTQVASSGAGSVGKETSYFGLLTLHAVQRFQQLKGIPATGYVGTLTRTALNKLVN